jgi:hypothetical protein
MSNAEMKALADNIQNFVKYFTEQYNKDNAASAFSALAGFLSGLAASLEARSCAKPEEKP